MFVVWISIVERIGCCWAKKKHSDFITDNIREVYSLPYRFLQFGFNKQIIIISSWGTFAFPLQSIPLCRLFCFDIRIQHTKNTVFFGALFVYHVIYFNARSSIAFLVICTYPTITRKQAMNSLSLFSFHCDCCFSILFIFGVTRNV